MTAAPAVEDGDAELTQVIAGELTAALSGAETIGGSGQADLAQPCDCLRRMRRRMRGWCGLGVVSDY